MRRPRSAAVRRLLATAAMLAVCAGPARLEAQGMSVQADCAPAMLCDTFRFSFLPATATPLSLVFLQLTFQTPGWTFTDGAYRGADAFTPAGFGPFVAALGGGGLTASFDLASDVGWFEVSDVFTSWLEIQADGPGSGTFAWDAIDFDGASLSGTGVITGAVAVVPEPLGVLLLATGLIGLGAARAHRTTRNPEHRQVDHA
jgi:hypothetical protein